MTRKPFSHQPKIFLLLIFFTLLSLILAIDPPPNTDVTWLYPIVPPTNNNQNLTYNTLDTLNVTWISSRSPAYLTLTCQDDNDAYTSVLKTQVPATGNRLVGLSIASGYQGCHFELSAPSVMPNISHGVGFEIVANEDESPVFWTSLSSSPAAARSAGDGGSNNNSNNTNKYKMVGIGVGVAVGVFASTTAGLLLVEIHRRKRRLRASGGGVEGEENRSGAANDKGRVEEWVRETTRQHHQPKQEGLEDRTGSWEMDADFGQRHEVHGVPVGEMDAGRTGCAG
ncbi:MAG: hypothetical protein LQ352_003334 [Teloschistes flavicans]|nr:MAG: hypothetical protein LQ352_003334 [Teloschistes flavicans]